MTSAKNPADMFEDYLIKSGIEITPEMRRYIAWSRRICNSYVCEYEFANGGNPMHLHRWSWQAKLCNWCYRRQYARQDQ